MCVQTHTLLTTIHFKTFQMADLDSRVSSSSISERLKKYKSRDNILKRESLPDNSNSNEILTSDTQTSKNVIDDNTIERNTRNNEINRVTIQEDQPNELNNSLSRQNVVISQTQMRTQVNGLMERQVKLDRIAATKMPELHCIGQILSGCDLIQNSSEGTYCRYLTLMRCCGRLFT